MKLTRQLQSLLVYTILVIIWGAWVRISHSGDGCGDTWPLCRGQMIPVALQNKTWIEYAHRLMSGIYGIVVFFVYWKLRKNENRYLRNSGLALLVFMITEALLGAKLVLFKLVGSNDTGFRAFAIGLHQFNSMLLVGSCACAVYFSENYNFRKPSRKTVFWSAAILIVAVTGSWASLSNTLFPTTDLLQGFMQDFSSNSHFLIRLRGLHPLLAATFCMVSFYLVMDSKFLSTLFLAALTLGLCTLLLHAPVPLKLAHLCMAHVVWITLIRSLFFIKPGQAASEKLAI